jgi:hypothetical protein
MFRRMRALCIELLVNDRRKLCYLLPLSRHFSPRNTMQQPLLQLAGLLLVYFLQHLDIHGPQIHRKSILQKNKVQKLGLYLRQANPSNKINGPFIIYLDGCKISLRFEKLPLVVILHPKLKIQTP